MDKPMYCIKCKKVTKTNNIQQVTSKNNRQMLRGNCAVCGITKTQFIKGAGLLNTVINSNLLPEMHLPGHNFTGPFTNLNKRLNPDLTPKQWSKPINRVDRASMNHDICYLKNPDTKTRNQICDNKMLEELNIINPTLRERFESSIVKNLIGAKKTLGIGLKSAATQMGNNE